jgi:hypothetical protein
MNGLAIVTLRHNSASGTMAMSDTTGFTDEHTESYRFTDLELARLATYRAAVRIGFYTDVCDETTAVSEAVQLSAAKQTID